MPQKMPVASTTSARKRGAPTKLKMLKIKSDEVDALTRFKLPAGVEIALVSERLEAVGFIKKLVRGRINRVTEVILAPSPRKTKPTPVMDRAAFEPDARSRALLEGIRIAQADLRNAGGAYDLSEVRTLMRGVSRQAIDKRVQDGSLLAVPGPSNRRSYPTAQFNRDGTVVAGLKAVREALQTRNAWTVLNFLCNADPRLQNRKPIEMLKTGKLDLVLEAARRHGEQGA